MSPIEVKNFEISTKKTQEMLGNIESFMMHNNIIVDQNNKIFLDAKTNLPISETDIRIKGLHTLLQNMEHLKQENLADLEELKNKQQEMVKNPKDKK